MNLTQLALPQRVLFTGYLAVVAVGLLMAGLQLLLTHGMADGEFGLSVDDVVYSYHGDRGGSVLEAKLKGSMKDKAPTEVRADIVEWVQKGSSEQQWDAEINAVFAEHCIRCHGGISGLPSFTSYAAVKPYAEIDEGATIEMGPMDARSRRLVHIALHEVDGVVTRSEGEGAYRRVCVEVKT